MATANSARNRKAARLKVVTQTAHDNSPEKIRELAFLVLHYAQEIQAKHVIAHAIASAGQHWLIYEDADLTAKNLFGAIVAEVETDDCEVLVRQAKRLWQLMEGIPPEELPRRREEVTHGRG